MFAKPNRGIAKKKNTKCKKVNAGHFKISQALSVVPARQVATASQQDAQQFAALARVAEQRLGDFKLQHLANTAWAFATASQQDAQLFAAFARATELCLDNFKVQELANTASAFAMASQQDAQLFAALVRAAELRIGDF